VSSLWHHASGAAGLYSFFREGAHAGYNQPRSVTTATTLLATDRLLLCTTTGGAFTVTLGPAQEYLPVPYFVKLIAGASTLAWNTAGMTKIVIPCLVAAPGTWGWVEVNT
jgi:hypothetical protein